jgi:hypothetical protein
MFTEDGKPMEENKRIIEEAIAQRIQQQKNNQMHSCDRPLSIVLYYLCQN